MRAAFALLVVLVTACGARPLALEVTVAPSCPVSIPVGGSLQYELSVGIADAGAAQRVCGACLPVDTAISDTAGVLALVRARAPSCAVERDSTFRLRLNSFAGAGCTAAVAGVTAARLCAISPVLSSSDGRNDQRLAVTVSCAEGCDTTSCVPTSCAAEGKDCGSLPNGCGETLDCGTCKGNERCGGGGTDNVCGR